MSGMDLMYLFREVVGSTDTRLTMEHFVALAERIVADVPTKATFDPHPEVHVIKR